MADITMCGNSDKCSIKETCYRHTARPNENWQSYSNFYKKEVRCSVYLKVVKSKNFNQNTQQ